MNKGHVEPVGFFCTLLTSQSGHYICNHVILKFRLVMNSGEHEAGSHLVLVFL